MRLLGTSLIGFGRGQADGHSTPGFNPTTKEPLAPAYHAANAEEVDAAACLAKSAFFEYGQVSGRKKADLLNQIAANLEACADAIVARAKAETALPEPRLRSELARTTNQLRMFAELIQDGSWVDARIDQAHPDRSPFPKPDVRSMLQPLGPVVVFCASNFPLAFSVAGGDTASALAAGNPVIVKAHHAHPGTAEIVGTAVIEAVRDGGLPEGVFSLIYGRGSEVGAQLIRHPAIKAGGFTGSRAGGLALMRQASSRPEPIPFYAEMSSVNPIFVLPGVLPERAEKFATGLHASVTLGAGQFCTNPGLVFVPDAECGEFIETLSQLFATTASFTMLTTGISEAYRNRVSALSQTAKVECLVQAQTDSETTGAVLMTDVESFLTNSELSAEVFGPSTLLVKYAAVDQLLDVARRLEGQLTVTIHGDEQMLGHHRELIATLADRAGRLIFNGFPTGVEVGHAMVHGGPFPATSDGRSTSVGTRAILRFARAVCYQDWPNAELPVELQNANSLGIWRLVDGQLTKENL
jgi:2,5-dioxopentanoate dehydrogenase